MRKNATTLERPASAGLRVQFPMEGDVVSTTRFAFCIEGDARRVSIALDGDEWRPCRRADGCWWFDCDCEPGRHQAMIMCEPLAGREVGYRVHRFRVEPPAQRAR